MLQMLQKTATNRKKNLSVVLPRQLHCKPRAFCIDDSKFTQITKPLFQIISTMSVEFSSLPRPLALSPKYRVTL